jgi:hypothetical protein
VDTDENEGRAATRAKNLEQAALEVTEHPEFTGSVAAPSRIDEKMIRAGR